MKTYLDLMQRILDRGEVREDRTGTGTIGLFGEQLRIDLAEGFPLLTTKRVPFKSVVAELLWFLRGSTDAASLRADGCTIWDEWATREQCARFGRAEDDLGPIYGFAWRHFGAGYAPRFVRDPEASPEVVHSYGFDQIAWLVSEIKKNPFSRRLIVSAWNPSQAAVVALPPCHTLFQCCVRRPDADRPSLLSLHLYMRSADYFLGVPFNVASYALLTHMIARDCGLGVGELIVSFGDVHLYRNHLEQAREQLSRRPRARPTLRIAPDAPESILDPGWRRDRVEVVDYDPYPTIRQRRRAARVRRRAVRVPSRVLHGVLADDLRRQAGDRPDPALVTLDGGALD